MEEMLDWRGVRLAARAASPAAVPDAVAGADEAADPPALAVFDRIRELFHHSGLPPEPENYELFWHYATGSDAALVRELDRLFAEGALTPEQVTALRRTHLGAIASSEVEELVQATQEQAGRLASGVESGRQELFAYDSAIAAEDAALAAGMSAPELSDLVQRLRRANARMMTANRRLETELRETMMRTSELVERLAEAETAARTDPLTGLLNRRGTLRELQRAREEAHAAGEALAAAMIDIDHFKRLNDRWGHAIGDEVLRHVAGLARAHLARGAGERAFVGRIGGEEFLAVMPGCGLPQACALVDAARATLARQVLRRAADGASLGRISFSAGVACARPEDTDETLIDRADAALYAAKRAGRDRVLPESPPR